MLINFPPSPGATLTKDSFLDFFECFFFSLSFSCFASEDFLWFVECNLFSSKYSSSSDSLSESIKFGKRLDFSISSSQC